MEIPSDSSSESDGSSVGSHSSSGSSWQDGDGDVVVPLLGARDIGRHVGPKQSTLRRSAARAGWLDLAGHRSSSGASASGFGSSACRVTSEWGLAGGIVGPAVAGGRSKRVHRGLLQGGKAPAGSGLGGTSGLLPAIHLPVPVPDPMPLPQTGSRGQQHTRTESLGLGTAGSADRTSDAGVLASRGGLEAAAVVRARGSGTRSVDVRGAFRKTVGGRSATGQGDTGIWAGHPAGGAATAGGMPWQARAQRGSASATALMPASGGADTVPVHATLTCRGTVVFPTLPLVTLPATRALPR